MSLKKGITFFFFVLLVFIIPVSIGAVQQTPNGSSQAASSQANMANDAEKAQLKQLAADNARSMQDDIKRMRAILQQMQSNLAFVDNTQSPLKHQFQLEIDMWNVLINDMERRSQAK